MFMVIFIEKRKYICLLSVTRFEYDEYGRQLQIDDPSAGGQTYTYDTDGLPTGRSATRAGVTVFAQGYSFDAGTGNLEERTDETRGLAELFTYDHLNRLTGVAGTAGRHGDTGGLRFRRCVNYSPPTVNSAGQWQGGSKNLVILSAFS